MVQDRHVEIYDGCSGGMSRAWRWLFGRPPPWEACCHVHDAPYARGGTAAQRFESDVTLLTCVCSPANQTGKRHPHWGVAMFYLVRLGGHPLLPTPWRWGFEEPYLKRLRRTWRTFGYDAEPVYPS